MFHPATALATPSTLSIAGKLRQGHRTTDTLATLLALAILLAGCGGSSSTSGPVILPPSAELDCVATGIPCALSDVPLPVLERSDEIADNVSDLLNDGMSLVDALDWILDQDDVVDAQADDTALRFRVREGRPVWILTQAALAPAISESLQPVNPAFQSPLNPSSLRSVKSKSAAAVVGENTVEKTALSLAPFKYAFNVTDDASIVADILADTRGYSNSVVLLENRTRTSTTVGISNFKVWNDFDVIHVTSHGATICDVNDHCSTVIYTGDTYGNALELLTLTELGVSTARIVGDGRNLFAVGADFFKSSYPEGLSDSLVYINACETLGIGDNDVADALLGDHVAYIGWSQPVQSNAAQAAAAAFYSHASEHGSTATEAWSSLGPLQTNVYRNKAGLEVQAELLVAVEEDQDVRIREIIALLDPDSGKLLTDGAEIAVIGTPGDGSNDSLDYRIQVDDVAEGQADRFVIHLVVDGLDAPTMTAAQGEAISDTSWVVSGELPLGRDAQVRQMIVLESWVELPDGGISEHAATPVVRGASVEAWEGQATAVNLGVLTDFDRRGTVTVRFELESERNGIKRFRIASGEMAWSASGTVFPPEGPCQYQFGPIDVPVVPFTGNRLVIDTTQTPATYTGFGQTEGGEIRLAEGCGDGAFSTRPRLIWFNTTDAENLTVSLDGNTITGRNASGSSEWQWSFTRR